MSTTFTNTGNFTGNLTGTGTNSANTNTGMATGTGTGSWASVYAMWSSRTEERPMGLGRKGERLAKTPTR